MDEAKQYANWEITLTLPLRMFFVFTKLETKKLKNSDSVTLYFFITITNRKHDLQNTRSILIAKQNLRFS